MSPDDERHGTRRGYYAHRKDGEAACEPCKRAAADAQATYERNRYLGRSGRAPARGTKRRLQALHALGWTWADLAREFGTTRAAVEKWANEDRLYVYASTAAQVAAVYERLCMTVPEGWIAERTRKAARLKGYAPPLAYDDIDRDPHPVGYDLPAGTPDPVVVERLLAGERIDSTRAEKVEALRRWMAAGGSERALCQIQGWKAGRYVERDGVAA